MLIRIATIALNTYREAARARVLYGLVGLAIATTLYSIIVGAYTLRSSARVVADLGSSSISIYAIVVSIVLAASSLYRELEQKTIFPILARPIRRWEYIVGKYLGTLLTLGVFVAIDGSVVLLTLAIMGGQSLAWVGGVLAATTALLVLAIIRFKRSVTFVPILFSFALLLMAAWLASVYPDERRVVLGMCALTMFEVGIVTAIATVFAAFSSPFLTAVFTLGIFVMGRQADTLAKLPARTFGQGIHNLGVLLSKILPNLYVYVPARPVLTGEAIDVALGSYLSMAALQSLGWSIALLAAAVLIFKKRDFL